MRKPKHADPSEQNKTLAKVAKPYNRFGVVRDIWVQLEGRGRTISRQAASYLRSDLDKILGRFDSSLVKRQERGWAGHFIAASNCLYHRNTLLTVDDRGIVVSTVGNYHPTYDAGGTPMQEGRTQWAVEIGYDRYYETMIFGAKLDGPYVEANVQEEISSGETCGIHAPSTSGRSAPALPKDVDEIADAMHEGNVQWVTEHFNDCLRQIEERKAERAKLSEGRGDSW